MIVWSDIFISLRDNKLKAIFGKFLYCILKVKIGTDEGELLERSIL
jgi:hypothetical protein